MKKLGIDTRQLLDVVGFFGIQSIIGTCCWTGYGFWPLGPAQGLRISMIVCPKQGMKCPKRDMVARVLSLNVAHTVFSNPSLETFASL